MELDNKIFIEPKNDFEFTIYNYKTEKDEQVSAIADWADYLPQGPATQSLYQVLILQGYTPLEAAEKILLIHFGEK